MDAWNCLDTGLLINSFPITSCLTPLPTLLSLPFIVPSHPIPLFLHSALVSPWRYSVSLSPSSPTPFLNLFLIFLRSLSIACTFYNPSIIIRSPYALTFYYYFSVLFIAHCMIPFRSVISYVLAFRFFFLPLSACLGWWQDGGRIVKNVIGHPYINQDLRGYPS